MLPGATKFKVHLRLTAADVLDLLTDQYSGVLYVRQQLRRLLRDVAIVAVVRIGGDACNRGIVLGSQGDMLFRG